MMLKIFNRFWNWLSDKVPELGDFDFGNEDE